MDNIVGFGYKDIFFFSKSFVLFGKYTIFAPNYSLLLVYNDKTDILLEHFALDAGGIVSSTVHV